MTDVEKQYNQKMASDYQLKILPDKDFSETLEETLTIPIKKMTYDNVSTYTYIIKEDYFTEYLNDSQFASNTVNGVKYIGFPSFVIKQKKGGNASLTYDTYDLRPDNVRVTSDSSNN
ncbi:hypothetical protein HMPREF9966_0018 [Streptococcus anginosus SK52 = DSM 20563]|uniref:hypothetical protein n=1 Tax=Streptococcus anginosus TaxID=1328 RepID=UPI00020DEB17|nr:hypothetical protein [Streptococcus anginosus]EGL45790.1 hypothetical protein HMPREF9966_0018 [Streptococcus anginosus SK52 = DSM 20563]